MKKKVAAIITGITLTLAGGTSYAEMDHSMGSHDSMGGKMKHEEMKMPEGMSMKTLQVNDYKLMFHIMDMPAYHKMMKTMGMKHSQMEGDTSHHIMVDVTDKDGKKVNKAAVKVKVIDPGKESQEKPLKPMMGQMGQYGADFKMIHKGKYQIMTLFKVGGKMHKGGFWHEQK